MSTFTKLGHYTKSKPLTVEVDRNRWHRGRGSMGSKLLREEDGHCCCLGFACRAIGAPLKSIRNVNYPRNVAIDGVPVLFKGLSYARYPLVCGGIFADDTKVCTKLASINDKEDISDAKRERSIQAYGKQIGLRFVFKG